MEAGRKPRRPRPRRAFTLVEILIVVAILAILAALVVPQFAGAAANSRDNSIKMTLHRVRIQLEVYREQHSGNWPTLAQFEAQLTGKTDGQGNPVADGTPDAWGPYIREIPINPNTNGATVGGGNVGTSDWFYDENTGEFRANDSVESRQF